MSTKELKAQALKLPAKDRADLAERLLRSLDEEAGVDPEIERLWVQEAERRYRAYKEGRMPTRSLEQVLRTARARAKAR